MDDKMTRSALDTLKAMESENQMGKCEEHIIGNTIEGDHVLGTDYNTVDYAFNFCPDCGVRL